MPRPAHEQPTPAELAILKILWEIGRPCSVREVMARLNEQVDAPRAYTTVMSLLTVMTEKRLVLRSPQGRAFLYAPSRSREKTLRSLLSETLERVYSGSASLLLAHLLDQSKPSTDQLIEIRALIDDYAKRTANAGGDACQPARSKRPSR